MGKPVTKIGNLTADPELRFSQGGTPWASFRIGVTPYTAEKKRPAKERTEFYDVVCFRTLAEHVCESLSKGDRAIVQGDGSVEQYTKDDGTEGSSKKILANHVGAELRFATATVQRVKRSRPADSGNTGADETDAF